MLQDQHTQTHRPCGTIQLTALTATSATTKEDTTLTTQTTSPGQTTTGATTTTTSAGKAATSSSSPSSKLVTATLTSTLPDGGISVVTRTSYSYVGAESTGGSTTTPEASLQTNGAAPERKLLSHGMAAAGAGFWVLRQLY